MKKSAVKVILIGIILLSFPLRTVKASSESAYQGYELVIQQYQEALRQNLYVDVFNKISANWDGIGEYLNHELLSTARYYRNYGGSNSDVDFYIYYAASDINGDGIEELFIGAGEEGNPAIFSMFSLDGNQPVSIFGVSTFGYRTNLYVRKDGTLAVSGSGGVNTGSVTCYTLPQESCEPRAYQTYEMFNGICTYTDQEGVQTNISENEYFTVRENLSENEWKFSWNLIETDDEYVPLSNSGMPNAEVNRISRLTGLPYIGNSRIFTPYYYQDEYSVAMNPVKIQGILGCLSLDFDNDGIVEILAVTYEQSRLQENMNTVRLTMYENENGQWFASDEMELVEDGETVYDITTMYSSFFGKQEANLFVRNCGGQCQIFIENGCAVQYLMTGSGWDFKGYIYDKNQFIAMEETENLGAGGSGFEMDCLYALDTEPLVEDEYVQWCFDMIERYRALGFASEEIGYGHSTVSQDSYCFNVIRWIRGDKVDPQNSDAWMRSHENDLEAFWIDVEDHTLEVPAELPVFEQIQGKADAGIRGGDYIIANSDIEYLSKEELAAMKLSKYQLRIARNEIYARHGRTFHSQELQDYFESKAWYVPQYSPEEFDENAESILSEIEFFNIDVIVDVEEEKGY